MGYGVAIKARICSASPPPASRARGKREIGHACNGRAYEKTKQAAANSGSLLHARVSLREKRNPRWRGERSEAQGPAEQRTVPGEGATKRSFSVARLMNSNI